MSPWLVCDEDGMTVYFYSGKKKKSLLFRRSIYVAQDISEGDVFTVDNIRIVRPGDGASPGLYNELLGKTARTDFVKGTPLRLDELL